MIGIIKMIEGWWVGVNKVNRKLIRGLLVGPSILLKFLTYIFLCRHFNIFIYYYPNGMRIVK